MCFYVFDCCMFVICMIFGKLYFRAFGNRGKSCVCAPREIVGNREGIMGICGNRSPMPNSIAVCPLISLFSYMFSLTHALNPIIWFVGSWGPLPISVLPCDHSLKILCLSQGPHWLSRRAPQLTELTVERRIANLTKNQTESLVLHKVRGKRVLQLSALLSNPPWHVGMLSCLPLLAVSLWQGGNRGTNRGTDRGTNRGTNGGRWI